MSPLRWDSFEILDLCSWESFLAIELSLSPVTPLQTLFTDLSEGPGPSRVGGRWAKGSPRRTEPYPRKRLMTGNIVCDSEEGSTKYMSDNKEGQDSRTRLTSSSVPRMYLVRVLSTYRYGRRNGGPRPVESSHKR